VADVLKRKEPGNLYDSVVSSQFDADRLDYMQRDRLMTGVQSSGIDATWLMANLEIGSVRASADDESSGIVETLVLGPKAFHAAENYVLSLFQLYPNVYLHKTTRAAEKLFCCLMIRIFELIRTGHRGKVGLQKSHPIRLFAEDPSNLEKAQALDDTIFWGAVPMMAEARDPLVRDCAIRLRERRLPKCIDLRRHVEEQNPVKPGMSIEERQDREARLRIACKNVELCWNLGDAVIRRRSVLACW
jgi:HD superfamily phosphohydrolase